MAALSLTTPFSLLPAHTDLLCSGLSPNNNQGHRPTAAGEMSTGIFSGCRVIHLFDRFPVDDHMVSKKLSCRYKQC